MVTDFHSVVHWIWSRVRDFFLTFRLETVHHRTAGFCRRARIRGNGGVVDGTEEDGLSSQARDIAVRNEGKEAAVTGVVSLMRNTPKSFFFAENV